MENKKEIKKQKKAYKKEKLKKEIEEKSLKEHLYNIYKCIYISSMLLFALIFSFYMRYCIFEYRKIEKETETKAYSSELKNINEYKYKETKKTITPYSVSDLTDTTWDFKSIIDLSTSFDVDLEFWLVNSVLQEELIRLQVISSNDALPPTIPEGITYSSPNNIYNVYSSNGWINNNLKTIYITGGIDATNQNFITWLQSNATQQSSTTQLTTPTIIKSTYNQISWSAIQNAESYSVYEDNTLKVQTNNTTYTAQTPGHTYKVRANGDGVNYENSELSNEITLNAEKLNTPIVSITNLKVQWQAVTNATSYIVWINNEQTAVDGTYLNLQEKEQNIQVQAFSSNQWYTESDKSNTIQIKEIKIKYNVGNVIISNMKDKIYTSQIVNMIVNPYNNYNLPQQINVTGTTIYNYTLNNNEAELTITGQENNEITIQIQAEYKSGNYTMYELLESVIQVPINTFYNMFNFEIFSVNLYSLLLSALTLFVIIKIYLKVFK